MSFKALDEYAIRRPTRTLAVAALAMLLACCQAGRAHAADGEMKAYRLRAASVADVEPLARKLVAGLAGAEIAVDTASNQLLVRGPAEAHQIVAGLVTALDQPKTAPAASLPTATLSPPPPDTDAPAIHVPPRVDVAGDPTVRFVQLHSARASQLEPILVDMFRGRIQPMAQVAAGLPGYMIILSTGERIELGLNRAHDQLMVRGSAPVAERMVRLITVLDSPRQPLGKSVRVIPLDKADLTKVRRATDAYEGKLDRERLLPAPSDGASRERNPARAASTTTADPSGAVAFANLLLQPGASPAPAEASPPPDAPTGDAEAAAQQDRLRQLGGNVDIEVLPDLDVLILSGDEREVDELVRIIQEIERISAETEPEIEVYHLRHAPAAGIATVLTQVQTDLLAGRQGRVTSISLVKPNAILLVGWGEALRVMRELVEKLDQPVDAETQLRVFRLKYAPAVATQTTIQQFFTNRLGLGAKVVIVADAASNSLIVQAVPRDLAEVELLIERLDSGKSGVVNQLRVFKLRNTLATDMAPILENALRGTAPGTPAAQQKQSILQFLTVDAQGQRMLESGVLSDVRVTPDGHTNTLLVSAPADSMELLAALIEQLDGMPAATAQIKVFKIVNGDAAALVEMMRTLLGPQATTALGPELAGPTDEGSLAPLRFSVDLRTNSIIATGSAGLLQVVEAILLRLDESDVSDRKSQVFRLKNSPAIDVALAVNEFLRSERMVQIAVPGTPSPFEQIEREVVVVPEPVSNSLIISATPRYFDDIRTLVEQLDAQPPQVLIQVLIAEVRLDNIDEFGVELGLQDSLLFDRGIVGNLATTGSTGTTDTRNPGVDIGTTANQTSTTLIPGFNFNNQNLGNSGSAQSMSTRENLAGQALSSFSVGRTNAELGFGGLVLSASNESINILIRALKQCQRVEVLSRPQIMTLDNQPSFIQVGERVPRVAGTTINQVGQVNNIELVNVGLILGVTPRISPDGNVVMEVDAERSELGRIADGIPIAVNTDGDPILSPRIRTQTAQTTISAADGQTVVLGGLIFRNHVTTTRRVPYLSSIPILGHLFRYDFEQNQRTELLIILTPHVIRNGEDAERMKQIESSRMSWCLADVERIHGECQICRRGDCEHCMSTTQVIYPDQDPGAEGIPVPAESIPAGRANSPNAVPENVPAVPYFPAPQGNAAPAEGPRIGGEELLPAPGSRPLPVPDAMGEARPPHAAPVNLVAPATAPVVASPTSRRVLPPNGN
ncbi:MAG: hypothetical protein KF708_15500 [Pirellulales bacterium]|nr:hypothetical protein [Pirellulales bacterium]